MELAEFNTGKVVLSAGTRAKLIEELGMSRSLFTKAITDLVENKAISKVTEPIVDKDTGEIIPNKVKEIKGEYIINPEMF